MKKKLFILPILTLMISGCGHNDNPPEEAKDVLPTSISVNPTSLDLKVNESKDLNNLLSFTFEPSNVTNKNVIYTAKSPYFTVSNSTITTLGDPGIGTVKVSSVADSKVFTNITINVIEDEPVLTKYFVTYASSDTYTINGLKQDGYLENEKVTFSVQIKDSSKELYSVSIEETTIEPNNDVYSFDMPNHDVTINVSLKDKTPVETSVKYDIVYDMGTRKTSYAFKEGEEDLIKNCFVTETTDIISSVSSFSYIYGGGYGGSGDNSWLTGDVLKFGTTSVNSSLSLDLTKAINKVEITGMVSATTAKVQVNEKEITCSEMAIAGKETVDSSAYTSFEVEIDNASTLMISTTNKKVLYIKSIKLYFGENVPVITEKYTVTWKNYDGTVLKVDTDVLSGSTPKYEGTTPSKPSDDIYNYVFNGWSPKPGPINGDTVYVATFNAVSKDAKIAGSEPVISTDNKTVEYGLYPQSHINDESLISLLNDLTLNSNNYVIYNNEYYAKVTSNVYNNESYTFKDGTSIINNASYWFKCETIKWNVINVTNNKYTLMSDSLLDVSCFYRDYTNRTSGGNDVYPNNYKESDVRYYLNNDFLSKAFFLGYESIIDTQIETYSDKIYLPSVNEINELVTKTAQTTDYSRTIGAFASKDTSYKFNGSYWTRTPSNDFSYCAWNVNSGGVLSQYAVDGSSHSIRPCIQISL